MDIVDVQGVRISLAVMVALYPGDAIVDTRNYFTSSFESTAEFPKEIVSTEINQECWSKVFLTVIEEKYCITAVSADKNV